MSSPFIVSTTPRNGVYYRPQRTAQFSVEGGKRKLTKTQKRAAERERAAERAFHAAEQARRQQFQEIRPLPTLDEFLNKVCGHLEQETVIHLNQDQLHVEVSPKLTDLEWAFQDIVLE